MTNIHIQEAIKNLRQAAMMKRDEKQKVLQDAAHQQKEVQKKIDTKHTEMKIAVDRATSSSAKEETAIATGVAAKLKHEINELEKAVSQQNNTAQKQVEQLENQARTLDNEATQLQTQL